MECGRATSIATDKYRHYRRYFSQVPMVSSIDRAIFVCANVGIMNRCDFFIHLLFVRILVNRLGRFLLSILVRQNGSSILQQAETLCDHRGDNHLWRVGPFLSRVWSFY